MLSGLDVPDVSFPALLFGGYAQFSPMGRDGRGRDGSRWEDCAIPGNPLVYLFRGDLRAYAQDFFGDLGVERPLARKHLVNRAVNGSHRINDGIPLAGLSFFFRKYAEYFSNTTVLTITEK